MRRYNYRSDGTGGVGDADSRNRREASGDSIGCSLYLEDKASRVGELARQSVNNS